MPCFSKFSSLLYVHHFFRGFWMVLVLAQKSKIKIYIYIYIYSFIYIYIFGVLMSVVDLKTIWQGVEMPAVNHYRFPIWSHVWSEVAPLTGP